MKEPNVLPATVAAQEKGCTEQAIYNALDRGDLNGVRMGRHRLVYKDTAYSAWQVKETGGRLHRHYQEKQANQEK